MAKISGDMAIQDLTPQTTNLGDRIVKNMRICGSGIYTYAMREAELLHLTPVPEKYKDLDYINVFRPAQVLVDNKEKFARVPIITGHHVLVNRDNAQQLVVGMVGDTVNAETDEKSGETYLYTTGTIVAGGGVDAYERYGQLSVGYDPVIEWCSGEHNGVPYQAVLKGFNDINHLLICKVARGGPQCMVMDSLDDETPLQRFINKQHGGMYMGVFKKIFGSTEPQLAGDAATVSVLLESIALGANAKETVKTIRSIAGDCGEEFNGFLDELSACDGEDKKDIRKAVDIAKSKWVSMHGDTAACEGDTDDKSKDGKSKDDKSKDDKSKDGDEVGDADDKSTAEKPQKPEDKPNKVGGDEAPSVTIDYDLLAEKVVAKMKPAIPGDEQVDEATAAKALERLSVAIAGDSDQNKADISSDAVCKSIWG